MYILYALSTKKCESIPRHVHTVESGGGSRDGVWRGVGGWGWGLMVSVGERFLKNVNLKCFGPPPL